MQKILIGCVAQMKGSVGTGVQWGAWGGSGMAIRTPGFMERMARMGLGIVQPATGLSILNRLLNLTWRPPFPAMPALFVGTS